MPPLPPSPTKTESSAGAESRCQYLDWDSEFFGRRIGSVREAQLSSNALVEIEQWCANNRIDCLYFLADFGDPETIRLAEEHDFRLVDIRLTLAMNPPISLDPVSCSSTIRSSRILDVPVLRTIARTNHRDSRFYFDPHFPRERCDSLYETWIEKSFQGLADAVFVPELDGRPAGYITCTVKPDKSGQIGLVGLAPEARGKGLAFELVQTALRWFSSRGVRQVTVVTQGRNIRAQRLYQRSGFATESVRLWYHRWFVS